MSPGGGMRHSRVGSGVGAGAGGTGPRTGNSTRRPHFELGTARKVEDEWSGPYGV